MSNSFTTPWTVAHQASLPMGFPRQEYWYRLQLPSPGDLPDSKTEQCLLHHRRISLFFFFSLQSWATREAPNYNDLVIKKKCSGGMKASRGSVYVYLHTYLWLIHIVVWQKPTQHYKAIILQLKIQINKKGMQGLPWQSRD